MWYFAGDFFQLTTNVLTYFFYYFSGDCMKIFLLFVLSLFLLPSFCSAQSWQRLDSDLGVLQWADSSTVYIGGTNGCLLRSKDKGSTWKQLLLPDSKVQINGIAFSSATTGCVVGGDKIFRTNDSGEHWQEVSNPSGKYITAILLNSSGIGTALSAFGAILRSVDYGATWSTIGNLRGGKAYNQLLSVSPSVVIAMNQDSVIISTDGGLTFPSTVLTVPADSGYYFYALSVSSSGTIFVLRNSKNPSNESALFISSDTGKTWQTTPAPDYTNGITFPEDTSGYLISRSLGIQFTKDKGNQFSQQHPAENLAGQHLTSIRFSNSHLGIAIGYRKKIYRTTDGGTSWNMVSYVGTQGNNSLKPIQFVSKDVGFVGTYPTTIFRTINAGATWLPPRKTTYQDGPKFSDQNSITALYFHTALKGCGFTDGFNDQFYTEDGGETINAQRGMSFEEPKMCFLDSTIGAVFSTDARFISQQPLVLMTHGYIGLTNDGGKTWTSSYLDSIGLIAGFYYSSTLLIAAGSVLDSFDTGKLIIYRRGIILRSTDGGKQWNKEIVKDVDYITNITALDDSTYILTGNKTINNNYYYPIYRTIDSGKTWTFIDSVKDGGVQKMTFFNNRIGYIVGKRGFFSWTADGGKTWTKSRQDTLLDFNNVSAVRGGAYMTAGSTIWRVFLPDSLTTSITEPIIEESLAPSVWLRYPRPVPTSGKIKLDAIWVMNLDASTIKIKLYDMLGIELRDITDSFHPNAGTNTGIVDFDGSALATGIYYIEISGGGYRKAAPVIIAR